MKWYRANFREDTWLARLSYTVFGVVFAGPPLSSYMDGGPWAYLVVATGYALFAFALWLSVYVNAPSRHERFTENVRLKAKLAPILGLGIALLGVALRWA